MKIALGCDHGAYDLKEALKAHLTAAGHEVEDFGCFGHESCDYPDYAAAAARAEDDGGQLSQQRRIRAFRGDDGQQQGWLRANSAAASATGQAVARIDDFCSSMASGFCLWQEYGIAVASNALRRYRNPAFLPIRRVRTRASRECTRRAGSRVTEWQESGVPVSLRA